MNKKTIIIMSVIVIITLLTIIIIFDNRGLTNPNTGQNGNESTGVRRITSEEARTKFENENAILLDVRTKDEYDREYIEGSILIPFNELAGRIETEIPNKEAIIIVYCQSGVRSKDAGQMLMNLGYKNIYDIGNIGYWPHNLIRN